MIDCKKQCKRSIYITEIENSPWVAVRPAVDMAAGGRPAGGRPSKGLEAIPY